MTDEGPGNPEGNGAGTAEDAKRAMTPRGHKLPQIGFDELTPLIDAMVQLHGPASRNLIFGTAGRAATGGTATTKWAALGYYGLREDLGDGRFEASERGRALVGDDADAKREAKQHALIGSGYRLVLDRFQTRPVNDTVLAGLLREEFGVPEPKAGPAAALLVSLAREAGFIVDGTFAVAPIEAALLAVPEPDGRKARPPAVPAGETRQQVSERRVPASNKANPSTRTQTEAGAALAISEGRGPFRVSVEIKIDAQSHSPEEIGSILKHVREALTVTED